MATHVGCGTLGVEKVFTYRPGDNGAPVLFKENFSGIWGKSMEISLFIVIVFFLAYAVRVCAAYPLLFTMNRLCIIFPGFELAQHMFVSIAFLQ